MKVGTPELLKFKKLRARLNIPIPHAVGLLEILWHVVAKNCPAGDVGRLSDEDIALMLEWEGDPAELITALVETGWIDTDDEFRLIVHDWSEHCPTYIKGNLSRHGKLFADQVAKQRAKQATKQPTKEGAKDQSKSISEPTTKPIQSKPIQSKPNLSTTSGDVSVPDSRTESEWINAIYQAYPRHEGKQAALPAIRKALKSVPPETLLAAVQEYSAAKQGTEKRFIKLPVTWFNHGCWTDDRESWKGTSSNGSQSKQARPGQYIDNSFDSQLASIRASSQAESTGGV